MTATTMRDGRLRRVRLDGAAKVIPGRQLPFVVGELYAQYMPPSATVFAWALRPGSVSSDYARLSFDGTWLYVEWGVIVESHAAA
jgi:hypothetical protein